MDPQALAGADILVGLALATAATSVLVPRGRHRVGVLLAKYGFDMVRHGRGQTLVNGNALIARLARALFDMGTPLWTFAPASELIVENGRVSGAIVNRNGRAVRVIARRGVVLASGGFAQNVERRAQVYNHPALGDEHISLTAPGNVGDGARMAESVASESGGAVSSLSITPAPCRSGARFYALASCTRLPRAPRSCAGSAAGTPHSRGYRRTRCVRAASASCPRTGSPHA